MEERRKLYVLGLSCSQLKAGAYALLLAEEGTDRRIPVVIGESEAQSIAIALEGLATPRPLTHDLFVSFAHAFGVRLRQVFIHRFDDGIFYAQVTFADDHGREVVMDTRTSDAIALAIRTDTPIFTTPEIIERTGFIIKDDTLRPEKEDEDQDSTGELEEHNISSYHADPRLENYTVEQLETTLEELIADEDYEQAQRVSEILARKKKN